MSIPYELHPMPHLWIDGSMRHMPREETKAAFADFMRMIPMRMTQLQRLVYVAGPAFACDFSRRSLDDLGEWLKNVVYVDASSIMQVDWSGNLPPASRRVHRETSPLAKSMMMDCGIYWAECLRQAHRDFRWERMKRQSSHFANMPVFKGHVLGFQHPPWDLGRGGFNRHFESQVKSKGVVPGPVKFYGSSFDYYMSLPKVGERGFGEYSDAEFFAAMGMPPPDDGVDEEKQG